MAEIISFKVKGSKVTYSVAADEAEAVALQGRIKDIRVIPLELCETETTVIKKGKNGVTQYFQIPTKYRLAGDDKLKQESCQVIDTETKKVFVYVCSKKDKSNTLPA